MRGDRSPGASHCAAASGTPRRRICWLSGLRTSGDRTSLGICASSLASVVALVVVVELHSVGPSR